MDSAGRLEAPKTAPLKCFAFSFAPANRPESGGAGSSLAPAFCFSAASDFTRKGAESGFLLSSSRSRQPLQSANCPTVVLPVNCPVAVFGRRGLAAAGRASRRRRQPGKIVAVD